MADEKSNLLLVKEKFVDLKQLRVLALLLTGLQKWALTAQGHLLVFKDIDCAKNAQTILHTQVGITGTFTNAEYTTKRPPSAPAVQPSRVIELKLSNELKHCTSLEKLQEFVLSYPICIQCLISRHTDAERSLVCVFENSQLAAGWAYEIENYILCIPVTFLSQFANSPSIPVLPVCSQPGIRGLSTVHPAETAPQEPKTTKMVSQWPGKPNNYKLQRPASDKRSPRSSPPGMQAVNQSGGAKPNSTHLRLKGFVLKVVNADRPLAALKQLLCSLPGFLKVDFHAEGLFYVCFGTQADSLVAHEFLARETLMRPQPESCYEPYLTRPSINSPRRILHVAVFPSDASLEEVVGLFQLYPYFEKAAKLDQSSYLVHFQNATAAKVALDDMNTTTNIVTNYTRRFNMEPTPAVANQACFDFCALQVHLPSGGGKAFGPTSGEQLGCALAAVQPPWKRLHFGCGAVVASFGTTAAASAALQQWSQFASFAPANWLSILAKQRKCTNRVHHVQSPSGSSRYAISVAGFPASTPAALSEYQQLLTGLLQVFSGAFLEQIYIAPSSFIISVGNYNVARQITWYLNQKTNLNAQFYNVPSASDGDEPKSRFADFSETTGLSQSLMIPERKFERPASAWSNSSSNSSGSSSNLSESTPSSGAFDNMRCALPLYSFRQPSGGQSIWSKTAAMNDFPANIEPVDDKSVPWSKPFCDSLLRMSLDDSDDYSKAVNHNVYGIRQNRKNCSNELAI